METNVPMVLESTTIGEIERMLTREADAFASIHYVYVVDHAQKLQGTLSLKEVFRADKQAKATDVMAKGPLVKARAHTDQERLAYLALRHNLKGIPVVDKEDHFLGMVPDTTILRILDSEAIEDILRFGGVLHKGSFDDIMQIPILTSLKHRLPWLLLGLLGGMFVAGIVNGFEDVLSQNLLIAAFIPLVVYMADAVSAQMVAFVIRDLATSQKFQFIKYLGRQFTVVVLLGAITSILLFVVSLALYSSFRMSFVLVVALFAAILTSLFTGVIVPFMFSKFRLDPANASGPIATIIQDILSVFVYFSVARLFL